MKRILIVDDNSELRGILRRQLASLGYEVGGEASNGEAAIELAKQSDPDLVLMDIDLGSGIDGIDTAKRLADFSRAAIVFLSAQSGWDTVSLAVETKPFGFLLKPYQLRDLYATIETATVRHEMDVKLRNRDRQLKFIESMSHLGTWHYDELQKKVKFSASASALIGLANDGDDIALDRLVGLAEPGDRDRLIAWLTTCSDDQIRIKIDNGRSQYRTLLFHRDVIRDVLGSENMVSGIVQDITDGEHAAEVGRVEEGRHRSFFEQTGIGTVELENLINSIPDSIFLTDSYGIIRVASDGVRGGFGYEPSELIGKSIEILLPPDLREKHVAQRSAFYSDGSPRIMGNDRPDIFGLRKDGSTFPVNISLSPVQTNEGLMSAAIVRNMSDYRRMTEKVHKVERNEAIGQLTGGIAHDFNNLLAVIQGNVELISDVTPKYRDELDAIHRATARGAELTNWLLSYSGRQTLRPKPVNLVTFVDNSIKMLARAIREDIEIVIERSSRLPVVSVDEGQLETAVLNLAVNARDAMKNSGCLTISTGIETIEVGERAAALELDPGQYGYISVSDTGSGIDKDIFSKVLEPFFTTKEVGGGTGLGLSMVYGFSKQSGGGLEIQSKVGIGTTVRIFFPLTDDAAAPAEKSVDPNALPRGAGEKIFLIEDDPDVSSFLVKMIEGLGYSIVAVADGDEALRRSEDFMTADLILSDVILPGPFNGPELIEKIRNMTPKVKTVLISGYPRIFPATGTLPGNADSFMSKPFSRRKLADVLNGVLKPAAASDVERH